MSTDLSDWADEHGTTDDAGESMEYHGQDARKEQSPRLKGTGDHLVKEKPDTSELPADEDAECYCTDCQNRVTVGPDGDEYGHELACEWSCYERRQA